MERSSLISSPSKPMAPRMISRASGSEVLAGCSGSMAVNTTWAVMAAGASASARNVAKSAASSCAREAVTTADQAEMLSLVARPWRPGHATIRSTPPALSPSMTAGRRRDHLGRRLAMGAIPDYVVRARHGHVEDRRAVRVDAEGAQVLGEQTRDEEGGAAAGVGSAAYSRP